MINRLFEITLVLIFIFMLIPLLFLISITIKISSKGPIFHKSLRMGKDNNTFLMYKFRTMHQHTPLKATHLLPNPKQYLTPVGSFLRNTSLDELPQLLNIFFGEMTFVGPRPALYNQYKLIKIRTKKGIEKLKPGITGYAQINGRDTINLRKKVDLDLIYYKKKSICLDIKIVLVTIKKLFYFKDISH